MIIKGKKLKLHQPFYLKNPKTGKFVLIKFVQSDLVISKELAKKWKAPFKCISWKNPKM